MLCARCAPSRPETFQRIARRLSSNRAPESTREDARAVTMADLIEVRDRSSVSSAAARVPPALAPARSAFHSFRASFSLTPLTARAPPQTKDGNGDKAEAVDPVAELPDAEEESVALVDTKVLEEEEKLREQRKKEEDANQPTVRAPSPALFTPSRLASVAATSRGPVPTQFRCPRHPARRSRRPRRLSRAPRRPRVTTRAIARARAPSTTRARPARAPRPRSPTLRSPNFSKLARWRALAWTAGF